MQMGLISSFVWLVPVKLIEFGLIANTEDSFFLDFLTVSIS